MWECESPRMKGRVPRRAEGPFTWSGNGASSQGSMTDSGASRAAPTRTSASHTPRVRACFWLVSIRRLWRLNSTRLLPTPLRLPCHSTRKWNARLSEREQSHCPHPGSKRRQEHIAAATNAPANLIHVQTVRQFPRTSDPSSLRLGGVSEYLAS